MHLEVSECFYLSLGWCFGIITHSRFGDLALRFSVQVSALSFDSLRNERKNALKIYMHRFICNNAI